jgi:hypothetical protein
VERHYGDGGLTMSNDKRETNESEKKECGIKTLDSQENSNLCCCYVIKEDGSYENPCDLPANDCC